MELWSKGLGRRKVRIDTKKLKVLSEEEALKLLPDKIVKEIENSEKKPICLCLRRENRSSPMGICDNYGKGRFPEFFKAWIVCYMEKVFEKD